MFNGRYYLLKFIIKRTRQFYISFTLFLMLFTILNATALADNDTLSLSHDYFDARPSVQIKGGYVNITYIATDSTETKLVQVIITYPNDNLKTKNMTLDNGKYVYNHIYETVGKYVFHIVVEDVSENKNETTNKTFWITTDIDDIDNDGMPDWWEEKHGFNQFNQADAEEDKDGDGYTNVEEYTIGTHPLIKASFIQNAMYRLKKDWKYLTISGLLFASVVVLSLYGLFRRRWYEMD